MIDLMTKDDYELLLRSSHGQYYAGRWEYFDKVINIVKDLGVNRVIELGPGLMPIVKNGDVMLSPEDDQFGKPEKIQGRVIIHDGTIKPWPIEDKTYDIRIGLQVLEHLDNKQCRAFREIMRISERAILSFPYLWTGGKEKPSHRAHSHIDKELIADWTLNVRPKDVIEIPRTGPEFSKGPRLVYYWDLG